MFGLRSFRSLMPWSSGIPIFAAGIIVAITLTLAWRFIPDDWNVNYRLYEAELQNRVQVDQLDLARERLGEKNATGFGPKYVELEIKLARDRDSLTALRGRRSESEASLQKWLGVFTAAFALFLTIVGVVPLVWQAVSKSDDTKLDEVESVLGEVSRLVGRSTQGGRDVEGLSAELKLLQEELRAYYSRPLDVNKVFENFINRMLAERQRIKSTSRANLLFGLAFSIVALLILGYPLFVDAGRLLESGADIYSYVGQRILPRISVGLLIQVVGFFFLRLYVTNEMDLKHTKNEITNFEAWMIAAIAAGTGSEKLKEDVFGRFARAERNFILAKGQRSVTVENDAQSNDLLEFLKAAVSRAEFRVGKD